VIKYRKLYDISVVLGDQTTVYPDDSPFVLKKTMSLAAGEIADVSELRLSAHSGTHLDLPAHFFRGSPTTESWPLEKFVLPARVLRIRDPSSITRRELEQKGVPEKEALLFKTANSESGLLSSGVFSEDYVSLSMEAAELCLEKKAPLLGLDCSSLDRYGDFSYPVHRKVLRNGTLILENIDLKEVPEGHYTLFCFPLKIEGGEASPTRAVLAE